MSSLTWETTVPLFLSWLTAAGHQESTIKNRQRWLKDLAISYPNHSPATLTTEDLQNWLSNPSWQPITKKNAQATVNRFFHYLEITRQRTDNPARLLLPIKVPRRTARPIPAKILQDGLDNTRNTEEVFMILLGAYAGLRRAEIASLHTDDYRDGWLTVTGKGMVTRHIPAHPALIPYLERKTVGYYFPGRFTGHRHPDYIGRRISRMLGPGYTTHQLRHWFATTTYARDKDIVSLQQLMGHADIMTTQSYIQVSDEALTRAIMSLTNLPVAPSKDKNH